MLGKLDLTIGALAEVGVLRDDEVEIFLGDILENIF